VNLRANIQAAAMQFANAIADAIEAELQAPVEGEPRPPTPAPSPSRPKARISEMDRMRARKALERQGAKLR
jgi:hypothetical protein